VTLGLENIHFLFKDASEARRTSHVINLLLTLLFIIITFTIIIVLKQLVQSEGVHRQRSDLVVVRVVVVVQEGAHVSALVAGGS
jgi:hypothetical protein